MAIHKEKVKDHEDPQPDLLSEVMHPLSVPFSCEAVQVLLPASCTIACRD